MIHPDPLHHDAPHECGCKRNGAGQLAGLGDVRPTPPIPEIVWNIAAPTIAIFLGNYLLQLYGRKKKQRR